MARETRPLELLSVGDGVFLTVGMIIGAAIFKSPSMVASTTENGWTFLLAWFLGGVISLCGALVYAELASRHPHTGGEYVFLNEGMGRGIAFLFAWSRMTVIQTGAIAAVAFVFGDYASEIFPLGPHSSALWAAGCVAVLTAFNFVGTLQSKALQKTMETVLITSMVLFSVAAIAVGGAPKPAPTGGSGPFGLGMIFVLLAYGGWNEAAYLGGEVRDARRNMTRILVWGVVAVTALYLLVNVGYLAVLGHAGIRASKAVAADVMRVIAGDKGAVVIALIVCISVLTTVNAAIFTGARTSWALGRDSSALRFLGDWRERGSTPANALLVQGAITLLLVAAGAATPDGFNAMVAYTTPVFWLFMYLVSTSFFLMRDRSKEKAPFRTPIYPHIPFVFSMACLYMLYSSVTYATSPDFKFGWAVGAGLLVMAAGIPLYLATRKA